MKPQRVPSRADAAVQPAASAPREVCWKAFYDRQRRVEAVGGKLGSCLLREGAGVVAVRNGRLEGVVCWSAAADSVPAAHLGWLMAGDTRHVQLTRGVQYMLSVKGMRVRPLRWE